MLEEQDLPGGKGRPSFCRSCRIREAVRRYGMDTEDMRLCVHDFADCVSIGSLA